MRVKSLDQKNVPMLSRFNIKLQQGLGIFGGVSIFGILWWGVVNSNKNILICIFRKKLGGTMQSLANSILNRMIEWMPTAAIIFGILGVLVVLFVLIYSYYEHHNKGSANKLSKEQLLSELNNLIDKYK